MKRKLFLLVTIVAIIFQLTLSYAYATSYADQGYKDVSNNGAAATIETQDPYVTIAVSAWAMTNQEGYTMRFAQVGWWKETTVPYIRYFYEYAYDSFHNRINLGAATPGSNNNFKVGCDSQNMYFKINDINYGTVSLSYIPFVRNCVQMGGETHDTAEQSPGSVLNPVSCGSVQYKDTSNNWVTAVCTKWCSLSTQQNNIGTYGSSSWEIWDTRY